MAQRKKIHLVGEAARTKLRAGVDRLVNAVKTTLGPGGKNFATGVRGGPVGISNDGVSLAKEIQGADEFEDVGVRAAREATTKTNDLVGDGTTTSALLVQSFLDAIGFVEGMIVRIPVSKLKQAASETEFVVGELKKMAKPIETREELVAVARVSVEDEELAELIGGAQWDVGAAGTVLAEEHNAPKDEIERIYGVRVDNGYGTSRIANNQEKQALELKDVRILVTNKIFNKAKDIQELNYLFEKLIAEGVTQIVLMGRAFDETAIGLCVKNIQNFFSGQGGFPIYPINAPYEDMDEKLEDLAAATGGTFINVNERTLVNLTVKNVGTAAHLFCTRHKGIIAGPKLGADEFIDGRIRERVEKIKEKLKGDISPFEKRSLESRLTQLTAGTAIIKVGAETEQERKYRYDKVVDCVNAVKAAMEEGVVPGGGLALKAIADANPKMVIAPALQAPYAQICHNAGGDFEIEDWVKDPVKVVRTGFEKASSIARSLATTEVVVTWQWEKPVMVQQADAEGFPSETD